MSPKTTESNHPDSSAPAWRASPWLSPRRVRFWAILLFLIYTLGGFFLAPVLVRNLAVDTVRETTDRELAIGELRINPFVLSAEVRDLALRDSDGEALFALDFFRANFQLSSLFRWAWTFREVRIDGPYLLYERFSPEDDRFTRLLADIERLDTEPEPAAAEPAGAPRLLIRDLQVNAGRAAVRDHVPQSPVDLAIGPVTVDIHELNTLPDRAGRQVVEVRFPDDASALWEGSLTLTPLNSDGRLTVDNLSIEPLRNYLEDVIDLASLTGRFSVRTDYRIETGDDGGIEIALANLETDLETLAITGFDPAEPILAFDAVRTRGGAFSLADERLAVGRVAVTGLNAELQLDRNGEPRLLQLLPPAAQAADEPAAPNSDTPTPWLLTAEDVRVEQARIALQDRSVEPAANLLLSAVDVGLSGIDNRDGTAMPVTVAIALDGGTAGVEGQLVALPAVTFDGRATLDALPLAPAQPYLQQSVALRIDSGAVDGAFELALSADGEARANGRAGIDGLRLSDRAEGQTLLAWNRLDIDQFRADTGSHRFEISRAGFDAPYGRLLIKEDRSTNLDDLAVETATDTAGEETAPAEAETAPWTVVVGAIDFADGSMDFADRSLPLPFDVQIGELGGSVTTIESSSSQPASVRLEGKVGDYGLARIDGDVQVFDPLEKTDITMEFRNLLMSDLSPYSIEFAGRRIDEGKLNLDLEYLIEQQQLVGRNEIVVSDLVLGEKVDSPNAVSLPLDLAVALLKDSNGVIDIDLPVEGNAGDPEFRIGGVIWKAFTGLITKIVTAPFKLLGNLVGSDSEDLGQFEFLAGRADLTPPEMEKIVQLGEALLQRPQIAVDVSGVYAPAVDTPMLQYFKLRDVVYERIGREAADRDRQVADEMLAEEIRGVLEDLHRERFPDVDLETIRAQHSTVDETDPKARPTVDELAYAADLRDRLVASESVTGDELRALASARANAVREAFLAGGTLAAERLRLGEPREVEPGDGDWVVMELGVEID